MKSVPYDLNLWQNRQNRRMKLILRHLTTLIIVLGAAAAVYMVAKPTIQRSRAESAQAKEQEVDQRQQANLRRVLAANVKVDPNGDQQLLSAIARLEQRYSVEARLLHEAHVQGLRIDGRGEYLQRDRGNQRKVRWKLESQHDGVRASLLQIVYDNDLLIDRQTAGGQRIEKVDLWRLRRRGRQAFGDESPGDLGSMPISPQLTASFGGLPMLLESLRTHFEFTAPGAFRAPESLGLGSQPVLGLIGRWRAESLAGVLTDLSDVSAEDISSEMLRDRLKERMAKGPLPSRLPINVMVLLGKNDLFPYLIEFRSIDDPLASDQLEPLELFQLSRQPLARLQLHDVVFDQEIAKFKFLYEPPEEPHDVTDHYAERIEQREAVQVAQQQRRMASGTDDSRH